MEKVGMLTVEAAARLAEGAHGAARSSSGGLVLDHVHRVADAMREDPDPYAVTAALLHDTVEKTAFGWDDLRAAGADDRLLVLIDALTECDVESEVHYLARCARDPLACRIKRADILDKLPTGAAGPRPDEDARSTGRARAQRRLALLEWLAAQGRHDRERLGSSRDDQLVT
jgi:(p)ppGpp synthase/HD superfamily hydrolase